MATKELKDRARTMIEGNMNRARETHANEQKAFRGAMRSENVDDVVKETLQGLVEDLEQRFRAWQWILETINVTRDSHVDDVEPPPS